MIGKPAEIIKTMADANPETVYEVKEWHKKRTLTQNAYYWALIGEVSKKMKIPAIELHNRMLQETAGVQTMGGKAVLILLPDNEKTQADALKSPTVHMRPTSQVKMMANGVLYRTWQLLKGSHEMNTDEMAMLLDNLIADAQEIGVETLTWRELQEMREREKKKEERNAQKHHAESQ